MRTTVVIGINDLIVGGAQRLIVDQLAHVDRSRFAWHLVTLFEFSDRKDLYQQVPAWVTVHRIRMRGAYDVRGWVRLLRTLWSIRPNRLISHLFFANAVFRSISIMFRYRVITVEHNTYTNKRRWQVLVDRWLAPISAKIVAVSEEVRAFTYAQQRLSKERCAQIENGVDVRALQAYVEANTVPSARAALGVGERDTCLLNVARLTPQKNQRLLLKGFAAYVRSLPADRRSTICLLIAGEGALRAELEAQARALGMSERIRFLGAVMDMRPLYRAADVFVSTSDIEGMSIAYLEALAFGLPLVATATGGTRTLLTDGENGFLIRASDPSEVAKALSRWHAADQSMLREGAIERAARYDIRRNVDAYQCLLEE